MFMYLILWFICKFTVNIDPKWFTEVRILSDIFRCSIFTLLSVSVLLF